ncbi:MAG TPA: GNAT family N-acetyltransferase [Candidatus Dormibacteraeota bacterium]|nr:GNAT family N-acetyltransferase [Candidatus Dormibacteraeota bacterium]
MGDLRLRRFEPRDAATVERLHIEALRATGAFVKSGSWDDDVRSVTATYLDGGGDFLVGEVGGELVAMGGLLRITAASVKLRRMRVAPAWQRRRFGRALLEALEARALALGYAVVRLDTSDVQTAAQAMYLGAGYTLVARTRLLGFDALLFEKWLRMVRPAEPRRAAAARALGEHTGFTLSCEPGVGALLGVLAAAVPTGGRILEIGTGCGVGTAWIVEGLGSRGDVEVVSVESDERRHTVATEVGWPPFVRLVHGDGTAVVRDGGAFDLVFADAPAGKLDGLDATIGATRRGGVLVVDDMRAPSGPGDPAVDAAYGAVRRRLLHAADLQAAELDHGSGVIVAVRRHRDVAVQERAIAGRPAE